ncbi:hypothetical protein BJ138DRAFT_1143012, partial [Hygrophoropsis aurantiaca]
PSQLEIQREVEALRDIRRRSTTQGGPGALILDPDLPNPSSPTSPSTSYWSAGATQQFVDGDSSNGSHEDSPGTEERPSGSDDPFHLFWVPASLHPEIAPAEFRAFLKEHAKGPPPDGVNAPTRSSSLSPSSSGLGRKRSMLSRQYKPSENDEVEEEKVVPLRRNRTLLANSGPQLTISDLQQLEQLAEEASTSDDPSKLRNVLRRSLSLNVAPSIIDKMDNMPDMPDEADAPIIVPPPGQILRRAARTKIRKPSLPGDGGGHRFGAGRRNRGAAVAEPRTSSDLSSNDHVSSSDHGDANEPLKRPRAFSNESMTSDGHATPRPESYSEEASIYDSYAREEPEEEVVRPSSSAVPPMPPILSLSLPDDPPSTSRSLDIITESQTFTSSAPILHHPQPQRLTLDPTSDEPSRTPSPDASTLTPSTEETAVASTSGEVSPFPAKSPSPVPKKEKDKKGLFKWGSSGGNAKKNGKEREREKETQRIEKEKDSGFFGWLPGKKKRDDQASQSPGHGRSGRETAADMLGPSKSYVPSPSPQLPGMQGSYARYPIHVERAIYRLSHIKLANPRRPLYEQVLISNLMFWYLGVINKTQNPTAPPPNQGPTATNGSPSSTVEAEHVDHEINEAEERQRTEEERLEREREKEKEREKEREKEQQKKESPRRGGLTKAPSGSQGGRRAAETPVKGPQYEMQHRVMEQEYNGPGYGYGSASPTPHSGGTPRMQRQPSPPVHGTASGPQAQQSNHKYSGHPSSGAVESKQLPPGAMSPIPVDRGSSSNSSAHPTSRTQNSSSPPPHGSQPVQSRPPHRSRSPPAQNHNRYSPSAPMPNRVQASRTPTRSLSATASSSSAPLSGDGKTRKVASAHAVIATPNGRPRTSLTSENPRGEEEDLPLALYQQQQRRK